MFPSMHTCVRACPLLLLQKCARFYASACEDMKVARTNLLMGAHSIRDTYTTQPDDNANTDLSSWCFYSKMACFLGKLNGALADGLCILVEFFFPIEGSSYLFSM